MPQRRAHDKNWAIASPKMGPQASARAQPIAHGSTTTPAAAKRPPRIPPTNVLGNAATRGYGGLSAVAPTCWSTPAEPPVGSAQPPMGSAEPRAWSAWPHMGSAEPSMRSAEPTVGAACGFVGRRIRPWPSPGATGVAPPRRASWGAGPGAPAGATSGCCPGIAGASTGRGEATRVAAAGAGSPAMALRRATRGAHERCGRREGRRPRRNEALQCCRGAQGDGASCSARATPTWACETGPGGRRNLPWAQRNRT